MNGISINLKNATYINIIARYSVVFIQIIYNAILARLLTPEDYGIVAIINVFIVFFAILADMGIGSGIIQKKDLSDDDIQSIFSFCFLLSLLLVILFVALLYPISLFYNDYVYLKVAPFLAIIVFFSSMNTVPNAILLKEKKFIVIGIRQIVTSIVGSMIAIPMAYLGAGYYSLIAYAIFYAVATFVWNYKQSGLVLKYNWNKSSVNKIKTYSSFLFGFNIMNYFSRNLDNILIGKFMGISKLGHYAIAYQLMIMPLTIFTSVLTQALHPILSEKQDDIDYIYDTYLKTIKMLAIVGIYISVFCFFTSDSLINIIYGNQWQESVNYFRILSTSIWVQMICATSGAMFQVLNKTRTQFMRGIIMTVTILSCIILGIYFNDMSVVVTGIAIAYYSNFITMLIFLVHGGFNKSVVDFLKRLVPNIMSAAILVLVFMLLSRLPITNLIVHFIVKLAISGLSYIIILKLLKQSKYLLLAVPTRLQRKLAFLK